MRHNRRLRSSTPAVLGLLLSLQITVLSIGQPSPADAQTTNIWNGLGGNGNWSNKANWNNSRIPASSASTGLDFTGNAATSYNDLGAFELNSMQFDVTADLTLSGGDLDIVANGAALPAITQNSAHSLIFTNNLVLTNSLILNLANSGKVTFAGAVSGSGSLTIAGGNAAYTAVLAGSGNSYTGGTIVTGGALLLGANSALPSGGNLSITGALATATMDLAGHTVTVGNLSFGDGSAQATHGLSIFDTLGTGLLTLNGDIAYNPGGIRTNPITPAAYIKSDLSLASGQHGIENIGNGAFSIGPWYDLVVTGQISGNGGIDLGSLADTNVGMSVALTHAGDSYLGALNINNGSLYLGSANALPSTRPVTISNAGFLYLYIASDQIQAGVHAGSYNQTIGSLADAVNSGQGNIYLGAATLTVGADNTNTTFTGAIQDNDGSSADASLVGGSLVKTGAGVLTLGGQSTYTGFTRIDAGTLRLGIDNALPIGRQGTPATDLTLNGGVVDTNGHNQTLNGVTNHGGAVLIHGGASVLQLTGAYLQTAGTTQIDSTLQITPGQDLNVTGGQLMGAGAIGARTVGTIKINNAGGVVAPDDGIPGANTGTLTINGSYAQQSNGILQINLGGTGQGTTYDLLRVLNQASLAGEVDFKLVNGFTLTTNETFDFLTYGSRIGGFDTIIGPDPSYSYTIRYNDATGIATLIVGVPESSTLIIMAITGICLLFVMRRPPSCRFLINKTA